MAPNHCAKGCLDQHGNPVLLAGHKNKCPYRQNKVPTPVVDSPVDTASSLSTVSSPVAASSPWSLADPVSPGTVQKYGAMDPLYYDTDPFSSFGAMGFSPTAAPSPDTFNFTFPMSVDMPPTPFHFGPDASADASSLDTSFRSANISQDLKVPDNLSNLIVSALEDQCEQLSFDLNALLNFDQPTTPRDSVQPPVSHNDVDVPMLSNEDAMPAVLPVTGSPDCAPSLGTGVGISPSPPLSPPLPVASETDISDTLPQPATQQPVVPRGAGIRKRKRARNEDDDEDEPQLTFIASSSARTKAHSKRAQVLLRKVLAINTVTRPYVLLYIARPESICQKNGTAVTFMSNNLRAILGDTFLDDIHNQVAQGAYDNTAQTARDTNMEVERLRQEKKAEQLRRQEAEAAQVAAQAEAAKLRAQLAALEAVRTTA